jgi:hypothetical protein
MHLFISQILLYLKAAATRADFRSATTKAAPRWGWISKDMKRLPTIHDSNISGGHHQHRSTRLVVAYH